MKHGRSKHILHCDWFNINLWRAILGASSSLSVTTLSHEHLQILRPSTCKVGIKLVYIYIYIYDLFFAEYLESHLIFRIRHLLSTDQSFGYSIKQLIWVGKKCRTHPRPLDDQQYFGYIWAWQVMEQNGNRMEWNYKLDKWF